MSAVMQLVETRVPQTNSAETGLAGDVLLFELPVELRLKKALEKLTQLQLENECLRTDLLRRERSIQQRNMLLRNARIREQALRAQLASRFV